MKVPDEHTTYPLWMKGVKYLLDYNPFVFCADVAEKHFPELTKQLEEDFLYEDYLAGKPEDIEYAHERAVRKAAVEVLRSPNFEKWFEEEGHSMRADIEQFRVTREDEGYGRV